MNLYGVFDECNSSVKREAGVNPARTRHCDKMICAMRKQATDQKVGKAVNIYIFKSGDLPGTVRKTTSNWLCTNTNLFH